MRYTTRVPNPWIRDFIVVQPEGVRKLFEEACPLVKLFNHAEKCPTCSTELRLCAIYGILQGMGSGDMRSARSALCLEAREMLREQEEIWALLDAEKAARQSEIPGGKR